MKSIILNGENLLLSDLWRIATENTVVALDDNALVRVAAARDLIKQAVAKGKIIYGVTTGFGKLSEVQISPENTVHLQLNLVRSHACGVGEPVPAAVSRTIMALKLNNLLRGYSGVRRELILQLRDCLNRQVHPVIPSRGSVGASGDLAPLSHLALVLIGEGEAEFQGRRMSGGQALKAAGLPPLQLAAKEGLSLINGTQFMTALAALGVYRALNLLKTADIIAAMSVDALKGTPTAFEPQIHRLRNQLGQMVTAENILNLMAESGIRQSHLECKRVQDVYSIRCIPQVHGASRDAVGFVASIITRELNAVTDNPLVFVEDGKILAGGNFHGEPIAMALDFLSIALAELASISERRISMMMDPTFSELPSFLSPKPGLNSGLMLVHVTAAALVAENKILCHPACVDSIPTSANKEDHVSMGANAANKMWQVLANVEQVLALELICAGQSLDLRAPLQPGRGVALAHDALRNKVPYLDGDRNLSPDIRNAFELVTKFELLKAVEKEIKLQQTFLFGGTENLKKM